MSTKTQLELLNLLVERLERLSVDSCWSRRAGGLRGNILKVLSEAELGNISPKRIRFLIDRAFEILSAAAHEIPDSADSHLEDKHRN